MFSRINGALKKVWSSLLSVKHSFKIHRTAGKYIDDQLCQTFYGKRVAVIGPANTAMIEKNGKIIDRYDLIIRLNKGYQLIDKVENREYIGSRTDVLFARLDERDCIDPATFDREMLENQELKYLFGFLRTPEFGYYYRTVSFIEKFGAIFNNQLKILSIDKYKQILNSLSGSKPSVGYIALHTLMESRATEIYITGLTFYLTEYQDGYRDNTNTINQLEKFKTRVNGHNPNKELKVFQKMYEKNKNRITLDSFLKKHMDQLIPV